MFETKKLHRLTSDKVSAAEINTVTERHNLIGDKKDIPLLVKAKILWENMAEFRRQAKRCYMYTYGDQWGETITVDGRTMTQREYLVRQGNIALQTNQIRNKVDTIVGAMLKEKNEPVAYARDREEQQFGELMTTALQANCNKNQIEILYEKLMTDLLVRGLCVSRETYEMRNGMSDTWTDYCEPFRMIMDIDMTDPRFTDMEIIGRFTDESFGSLTMQFARSTEDYAKLRRLYPAQANVLNNAEVIYTDDNDNITDLEFSEPLDRSRCRVYEIWTKETKARYRIHDTNDASLEVIDADDYQALRLIKQTNEERLKMAKQNGWTKDETPLIEKDFFIDSFWYCRYLSPDGTILWEGESTLADRTHPFTICATPFSGGKIQGYITDAIDHQILINRTIVLQDWLIRSQAKGITVVPKQLIPDDMSADEFAHSYAAMDNMLFIDWKPGISMPQTLTGVATSFPASQLIQQYSTLMDNSTMVSGAMQGKTPYSGTSASLYAQQTANSYTPIFALMTKFKNFMEGIAVKKLKNIVMYYDEARLASISGGMDSIMDNANLNLNEVADIEYDLSIKESTETPAYRMVANETLMQMMQMGAVTPEEVLKNGYFPFADRLLQQREARQAEMQAAQNGEMGGQAQMQAQQIAEQAQATPQGMLPTAEDVKQEAKDMAHKQAL